MSAVVVSPSKDHEDVLLTPRLQTEDLGVTGRMTRAQVVWRHYKELDQCYVQWSWEETCYVIDSVHRYNHTIINLSQIKREMDQKAQRISTFRCRHLLEIHDRFLLVMVLLMLNFNSVPFFLHEETHKMLSISSTRWYKAAKFYPEYFYECKGFADGEKPPTSVLIKCQKNLAFGFKLFIKYNQFYDAISESLVIQSEFAYTYASIKQILSIS